MKPTPIETSYKKADKLLDDFAKKHAIPDADLHIMKTEVNQLMISLHNEVVTEMRENLLPEINKVYERHGYKKA